MKLNGILYRPDLEKYYDRPIYVVLNFEKVINMHKNINFVTS